MDEQKVREFIGEFFRPHNGEYYECSYVIDDAFSRNSHLANELRKFGGEAVDLVIEELEQRHAKDPGSMLKSFEEDDELGFPLTHIFGFLETNAEARHADRIAELLAWEELLEDSWETVREIVMCLGRVGNLGTMEKLLIYQQVVEQHRSERGSTIAEWARGSAWGAPTLRERITGSIAQIKKRELQNI
jgi:hypothetical protein